MTADYSALTDEELVKLAQDRDRPAEEELIERYKNMVRMKARPYFLMGADREDLIQEGMIGLFKAMMDYSAEHDTSFRSFADMCVHRQIITAIKRASRKKHEPLNTYVSIYRGGEDEERDRPLVDVLPATRTGNPEEMVISEESLRDVRDMLYTVLSPLEKRVLECFLDGLSYTQIAAELGCNTKSVDNALQRIKRKLAAYLRSINA